MQGGNFLNVDILPSTNFVQLSDPLLLSSFSEISVTTLPKSFELSEKDMSVCSNYEMSETKIKNLTQISNLLTAQYIGTLALL